MIVPMKKVLLLALETESRQALEALREAGVMQIDPALSPSADSAALQEKSSRTQRILSELEKIDADPGKGGVVSGAHILDKAARLLDERSQNESAAEKIRRRLTRLEVWGSFKRSTIDELAESGVTVTLCEGLEEKFEAACKLEGFCCQEISRDGQIVYFVLIGESTPDPEEFTVFQLAEDDDPAALAAELKETDSRLELINSDLKEVAGFAGAVRKELRELEVKLEFQQAADALGDGGHVVYLSGFVPEPELDKLRTVAQTQGWGLVINDPDPADNVPVLVKESKFSRIIKPLFDFLGVLPGYREMDVSGGVLVFFTIFYAMIIGDAGYGVLFLLLAFLGKFLLRKKPAAQKPLNLLILLSTATVIWGALSGSWFGIPGIPGIPLLTNPEFKDANVQTFCFLLALAQLATGRIWRAIHEGGLRSYIRHIGWALIIAGNFILTLKIIVWPGDFPVYMYWIYGAGLLMVMAADVNWRDPADCFQFPFNVIGSFTDVLSYIRLFAVGMAGSCIAASFNDMGLDVAKASVWFIPFGVLAILCGHVLNIALGFMSVLVHAVRLNTLEFSNHTGLSWSGQEYKPFKKNNMEDQ